MAPVAVVILLPATLIMEENVVGITLALARDDVKIIWYLLFNYPLDYFFNLTNFFVTTYHCSDPSGKFQLLKLVVIPLLKLVLSNT